MKVERAAPEIGSPFARPPFLYEIRVKGRLSSEQWCSWFDDLSVTDAKGETILAGKATDQAALHGILGRLRDLAIPLIAVRVLDAEAQAKLARKSRRYDLLINVLIALTYLALLGGLTTTTVLLAPVLSVTLALTLLFALLAGLAHVFWLWSGLRLWRWIAYVMGLATAVTFLVLIPLSGVLPTAWGLVSMSFLAAGGLIFLVAYLRRRADDIKGRLAGEAAPPRGEEFVEQKSSDAAPAP